MHLKGAHTSHNHTTNLLTHTYKIYVPRNKYLTTMAEQVRTAHLLIKHTGSRNPVSRRTGEQVTLSPEDALAELRKS